MKCTYINTFICFINSVLQFWLKFCPVNRSSFGNIIKNLSYKFFTKVKFKFYSAIGTVMKLTATLNLKFDMIMIWWYDNKIERER